MFEKYFDITKKFCIFVEMGNQQLSACKMAKVQRLSRKRVDKLKSIIYRSGGRF
jgi:hypothetical protein